MTWGKQYNFSATGNGELNSAVLQAQIEGSAISTGLPFLGIDANITEQAFVVRFTDQPSSGDETTLNGVVATHE